MRVGEFCSREVIIVGKDETIQEAARLMREHHVGDVVVVEEREGGRHPVGILTDRDIVVELLAAGIALDAVSIGDAMSFELATAREGDGLIETIGQMQEKGVRRIPVVDARGDLVGILAIDDLLEVVSEQLSGLVKVIAREQEREREIRH
ncbi:MAG: CBS domain-containing protein [Desulfuromonadales bacterium]|nr:CBS domain-containing protein [Desulfuromonadales bacterium]